MAACNPESNTADSSSTSSSDLKNFTDSVSYSFGVSVGSGLKSQKITDINTDLIAKGISDMLAEQGKFDEQQANTIITKYMDEIRERNLSAAKSEGDNFLAENGKNPDVITTASGLQYTVIREGDGPKPIATDQVRVHYHGTLIDGTVFDSSVDRGEPVTFPVQGVIPGWIEGLQLMNVGSKYKLFIPSDLAYGDRGAGAKIGPGATLVFDVELLEIVKADPNQQQPY
ncbi:FKBP-type peptidyl-prolyl cis-trans isomerase [bacterium SCSIO 12741]|nr:FKBP-type peptidyl-prolyl cis-trans isomerase [bacterium SCSIO 12741]